MTEIIVFVFIYLHMFCVFALSPDQRGGGEEDKELGDLVRILNKPAIKTLKNEVGDIFDCVDINKQPSLENPLLKNHKIQLKPSFNVKGMFNRSISLREEHVLKSQFQMNCPMGTVPIKRTTNEDLKRAKHFFESMEDEENHHTAGIHTKTDPNKIYRGVMAFVTLGNPYLYHDSQWSGSVLSVERGNGAERDYIKIGWMINPGLYGDRSTRFYTMWAAGGNKTGCFNLRCTGFIQVNSNITLDHKFRVSDYVDFTLMGISQDPKTGHWWLVFGPYQWAIGYWPQNLFKNLVNGADYVELGGHNYDAGDGMWPGMGTNKYSRGQYTMTASMFQVIFADNSFKKITADNAFLDLHEHHCYVAGDNSYKDDDQKLGDLPLKYSFMYGGKPGPKSNCP